MGGYAIERPNQSRPGSRTVRYGGSHFCFHFLFSGASGCSCQGHFTRITPGQHSPHVYFDCICLLVASLLVPLLQQTPPPAYIGCNVSPPACWPAGITRNPRTFTPIYDFRDFPLGKIVASATDPTFTNLYRPMAPKIAHYSRHLSLTGWGSRGNNEFTSP